MDNPAPVPPGPLYDQVRALFRQGLGYKRIASILGRPMSEIRPITRHMNREGRGRVEVGRPPTIPRRAKNAPVKEVIRRKRVFKRDKWTCGICLKPIDPNATELRERPSIDHIVPLELGGHHTYDNVRATHMGCNAARNQHAWGAA